MRPHINLNANLRSLRPGALVRYNGSFYLRGRFVRSCGIQLLSMIGNRSYIMYVPHDTIVQHYFGFPESLFGFGVNV